MNITLNYLQKHPNHIFVFGDNKVRRGYNGGAALRDCHNSYGFITKKYPSYVDEAYYHILEYREVFKKELNKLKILIEQSPNKTFLISKLGSGLANRYNIWKGVIEPELKEISGYNNVVFLWQ